MVRFFNNGLNTFFYQQREHLILWVPVGIALGILGYFSWIPYQLSWIFVWGLLLISLSMAVFLSKFFKARVLSISVVCLALGLVASQTRYHHATTPLLRTAIPKPVWVRGTVEEITQGINHKKIILKTHRVQNVIKNPPTKIQLIYRSKKDKERKLEPGDFVVLKAKLEPLQGPLVPHGYDFRQQAKFKQIGAQGYVVYVHDIKSPQQTGWREKLETARRHLTHHFLTQLSGQEGAIAAALITGDTASISKTTRTDFSNSGTAHILAISGLHLTLIGGLLLLITRLLVGCCPPLILRIPAKKIAAVLALIGAFAYLYISGCRVPTQRAFISFSLMMTAIVLNRNPISLRLVAIAATVILLVSPEVLFTPSFQLSFAAVTALIATYENIPFKSVSFLSVKGVLFYIAGILLSSIIASLATLPFTLYHFYKFTLQSLGSNLLMIPLLSLWVMPLCLAFILLSAWPLGQYWCALLLEKGISWMIKIAHTFAELPGSLIFVPGFSMTSFTLIVVGGLFLCLLVGKVRWVGLFLMGVGILYTIFFPKPIPFLFIAEEGRNIGLVERGHLFLSSPRRDSFLATIWASYAGIRPDHVHSIKKKKHHPLMPKTHFYGKNFLTTADGVKIGYVKKEEEGGPDLFKKTARILILPQRDLQVCHGSHSIILDKNRLHKGSWVCYQRPLQCTLS
jgi:competence protein ComEC